LKGLIVPLALFVAGSSAIAAAPADYPLVAIIDSGVARTAELQPALVDEIDMAAPAPRPAFQPRYDHGTMVATILSRAAEGKVRIISLRIDDPAGCPAGAAPPCQGDAAPVAAAIRRAADMGVDAINISLALADDPRITAAVVEATDKGIPVILAAGNRGLDRPANLGPARAAFPRAVLVGALDDKGQPWIGANRPEPEPHPYVYHWQRGVKVPTVAADGHAVTGTGTSFAVPIETARLVRTRTLAGKRLALAAGR
jgi:hypothetical protein